MGLVYLPGAAIRSPKQVLDRQVWRSGGPGAGPDPLGQASGPKQASREMLTCPARQGRVRAPTFFPVALVYELGDALWAAPLRLAQTWAGPGYYNILQPLWRKNSKEFVRTSMRLIAVRGVSLYWS